MLSGVPCKPAHLKPLQLFQVPANCPKTPVTFQPSDRCDPTGIINSLLGTLASSRAECRSPNPVGYGGRW